MAEFTLSRFADVHEAFCDPSLRQSLYDAGAVIMKDVLLTLHGPAHKTRRHLELRLFRRNYALNYERHIFPQTLSRVLDPLCRPGELDLVDFGFRVTMNLTADFAGIDRPDDNPEETERLLAIVKTFSEGATLVHSDRAHEEVIQEVGQALLDFQHFLKPSWHRRAALIRQFEQGVLAEEDLPRDVLTVLLRNQDDVALSDEIIERELGFYLQAGSHSTANAMVHAVHEIFSWTDAFDQLIDEPLLLQRCIHESLRLHPASPVAWRSPTRKTSLPDGQVATPDDLIILDLHAANRDPSVYGEDAEVFNPRRKILRARAEPYGFSFGTGVHMCTGRDLDGGIASTSDTDPSTHQYGIVCQLIKRLLQRGMKPHPTIRPDADGTTTRNTWSYYPVAITP